MELIRWNPMRDIFRTNYRFNSLFDDFFAPLHRSSAGAGLRNWQPVVDVYDDEGQVVIKAELPGVDKKDIAVEVKDGVLTLRGERATDSEVKEDNYYRRESACGKFERRFALAQDTDPEKISADYQDGVLKIEIPKPEVRKPKQITIH